MRQVEMRGFLYGLVYVSAQKERFPSRQDNTIKATVRAPPAEVAAPKLVPTTPRLECFPPRVQRSLSN